MVPPADRGRLDAIVVDNGSTDGTVNALRAQARWVEVVPAGRNTGFAAACNTGLGRVTDDAVIVVLNPDVRVDEQFFAVLREIDWPEDLAAVGPCVIGKDGELEQSARRFPSAWTGLVGRQAFLSKAFPSMSLVRRELLASVDGGARFVDWISGACMVSKPHVFRQVGAFDERYFMYWEDADWCRRAASAGLRVRYEPRLVVRHDQGASSRAFPLRTVVRFHRSALRYYRCHVSRSPVESGLAAAALTARALAKLAAAALRLPSERGRRGSYAAISDSNHHVTTRDDPDQSPLDSDEGPPGCARP
jgi:GT2 family glycosyltransferase